MSQLISGSVPKEAGKKPSIRRKGAAKTRRKEPAEVTCIPLSLTHSIPVQESLLPTSLSSTADTIDFEEQSTILPSDCVSLSFPYSATSQEPQHLCTSSSLTSTSMPSEFVSVPQTTIQVYLFNS